MRRPTSIRGACCSSTSCRSPAPTRSIANACCSGRCRRPDESDGRPPAWRTRGDGVRCRLSRSHDRRRRRAGPRTRLVAELPRRVHTARHAGDQGADAADHGARRRWRDRGGRSGSCRLVGGRPRAGRSDQPRRGRADGRDDAWRPRRTVPRAGPSVGADSRRRELRRCGGAAGRLWHRASHVGVEGQCARRRQGDDPRRQRRRRRVLRAACQAGRRGGGGLRQHRGEAGSAACARRGSPDQLRRTRLRAGDLCAVRQAVAAWRRHRQRRSTWW